MKIKCPDCKHIVEGETEVKCLRCELTFAASEIAVAMTNFCKRCAEISLKEAYIDALSPTSKKKAYFNALITVLKEQAKYIDSDFQKGEEDNLRYAFDQINPQTHYEMAFVVACGTHEQPLNHIVDEYVRRRKGEKSLLPDVEMAPPEVMGLPDTQRIIIFREQLLSLIRELTGENTSIINDNIKAEELLQRFLDGNISFELLKKELVPIYQSCFEDDYVRPFYEAILYYAPYSRSYVWCSTMVDMAYKAIS